MLAQVSQVVLDVQSAQLILFCISLTGGLSGKVSRQTY